MSEFAVIIVTYNPDPVILRSCIYSLYEQVDLIVLVKNSCEVIDFDNMDCKKIEIIQLDKNYGIAYAQNRGIEYSLTHEADFILFSDQDTIFPQDYVNKCFLCYKMNTTKYKIGAIVPLFFNLTKRQMSQVMISKVKAITPVVGKIYSLAHAISSGAFCCTTAINDIGMMNERMFIDYVDTEWCWRATRKGYHILCDTNIVIEHSMGENFKNILGRKIVVYSNFRMFFFFRNSFYLLFHSHLLNFREFLYFLFYTNMKMFLFFITNGITRKNILLFTRAMLKGIKNDFTLEEMLK